MKITFCGAAESVTGSCHLVEASGARPGDAVAKILLDCGQFQGSAQQEAQNYAAFPFDPKAVDFLILSHAHIDHCGRIPLLAKRGFQGRIYCTDATADLLGIMLRDSAHIHEKEAEWKNRKGMRAGRAMIQPLYTTADAEASLDFVTPVLYGETVQPAPGIRFVFNDAGHILGSAVTELWLTEEGKTRKLVFTGDLGVEGRPLLNDPTLIKKADVVIMETTYGDRLHEENASSVRNLADIIEKTAARGGTVLIPSFAVGRTQELIYELNRFVEEKGSPELFRTIKVYIDSPMAAAATEAFRKNIQDFDDDARTRILAGDDPLDFANLIFTRGTEESKSINLDPTPKIVISASGMCEAGRIRHHLKHHLWDARCSVVFIGYQAVGTLGRRLLEGAETVSLFGEEVCVRAEIHNLEGFSAHADRDGLLKWVKGLTAPPTALFLVHGEPEAKRHFAQTVEDATGMVPIVVEQIGVCELPVSGEAAVFSGLSGALPAGADPEAGGYSLSGQNPAPPAGADPEAAGLEAVCPKAACPGAIGPETAGSEAIDPEDAEKLLLKIRGVNTNLEKLLYEARLAVDEAGDERNAEDSASGRAAKYAAIKNVVLSLEKDTLRLASELAENKAR